MTINNDKKLILLYYKYNSLTYSFKTKNYLTLQKQKFTMAASNKEDNVLIDFDIKIRSLDSQME